jgi:glycosyltransferase involved in cell wall biosynthesis
VSKPSQSNEPLVTAIIPTYNRGYVVSRAIDSIIAQTYRNVEIIVVDDGSTDDTQEVLQGYKTQIRVIYQENAGPSAARNCGIRASRGDIIAFLDSDDAWLPTKLQRQVALLNASPKSVPCCLCNGTTRDLTGREWKAFDKGLFFPEHEEGMWLNVAEVLATRFMLFCQLVAIRRTALDKVGIYDESLRFMEDYDLALRLSIEGPWAFIREPLATINYNPKDSLSHQASFELVCHAQYTLQTRQRVLNSARRLDAPKGQVAQLEWAVRKSCRELKYAQLRESSRWSLQFSGALFRKVEYFRMAAYRRSPWFPKAKTVPIQQLAFRALDDSPAA